MDKLFPTDDMPVETLENGAMQSAVNYRYDLLDPFALAAVAGIAHKGAAKYGENNWHGIPLQSHLNHCLAHIYAYLAGDLGEPHLQHALCRMVFAVGKLLNPAINGAGFVSEVHNDLCEEVPSPESLDAIQKALAERRRAQSTGPKNGEGMWCGASCSPNDAPPCPASPVGP